MKKLILIVFLLISSPFNFIALAQNQDIGATIHRDVIYKTIDKLDLYLSLILPEKPEQAHKLIVILPDEKLKFRSDYEPLASILAESGFISLIADYRQPPDYSYPSPVEDVLDAVDWLKSNSDNFNIEIKAVGLLGQNFGGYLASLIGLTYPSKFQMVTAIHSPMDITTYQSPSGYPYRYHVFAGKPLKRARSEWKDLSPLYHAKRSSPPFLIFHGKRDSYVSISQSLKMKTALTNEMANVRLIEIDEAGNGYFLADSNITETVKDIATYAARAMVEIPGNVDWQKDIVYAEADGRKLHMDMYRPKDTNKVLPAVLFFHGGGWVWGRKEHMARYAAELAAHGFVTFTVEYRLAREALYPACIDDAKAAVRWIKSKADHYNVNPKNIGAVGQSAGGHISAMLGVTNDQKFIGELVGPDKFNANIQAVATLSGVVDMLALYPRDPFSPAALFGASPKENKQIYIDASPINWVSESSSRFLFIHGSEDHLGLLEEMVEMTTKLKKKGIYAETFTIEGGDHAFERYEKYRTLGFNRLLDFMKLSLKK